MAKNSGVTFAKKIIQWFAGARSGMVSDPDPKDIIDGGLYLTIPESGALNVRAIGDGTNVSWDYEPIVGNELVYQFAQPAAQNRIFRISISWLTTTTYMFRVATPNGTIANTALIASGANITASYNNIVAAINAVSPITASALTTTTATDGFFTVTFTAVPYWDYELTSIGAIASTVLLDVDILQEAIDPSMLGFWRCIGSDWKQGDLWQFWTTRITLPSTIAVSNVANSGGLYEITTTTAHNLIQNQSVQISATSTTAEGTWIVNVTSPTTFTLLGSIFAAGWVSGGLITINIFGYGMITVAQKNESLQTWTGTILLRSKEFNFSTLKQIDCRVKRKQDLNIALYFTDNFNPYRVFYYKGLYITDGGLEINGGHYAYGTIDDEILLDVSISGFDLQWIQQIQTGGNVRSGNWRYAARYSTEAGSSWTNWGLLTNAVSVTSDSEAGSGYQMFGRPSGIATPKQNVLRIKIPAPGIFARVQIAAINYLDFGYTGEIIGEYQITGAFSQTIIHTGFELNVTDLDIGTLNNVTLTVKHGRNIELLNNRAIKSNLTLRQTVDFSAFFENMTFSINRAVIPFDIRSFIADNLRIGEYQVSSNVYNNTSLMLNERYRSGFQVEFIHGGFSSIYWSRDYVVNNNAAQAGCTGALPNFDLTTGVMGSQQPYTFYVTWGGYNINTLIDGIPFKNLVKRIYHYRCKVTNPQVIAGGILIPAVALRVGNNAAGEFATWVDPATTAADQHGEFPFVAGIDETTYASIPIDYGYGSTAAVDDFVIHREYGSLIVPDFFLGHTPYPTVTTGDIIKNYGQPPAQRLAYPIGGFPDWDNDYLIESLGNANATPVDVAIDTGAVIGKGSSATISGQLFSKKLFFHRAASAATDGWFFDAPAGLVVHADAAGVGAFNVLTVNTELAIYNIQYFRAIADGDTQYGSKAESKYEYTGTFLEIDDNTPSTFISKGGDCFTQFSWIKDRYPNIAPQPPPFAPTRVGMGQGFGFYSQNRANSQMVNERDAPTDTALFPSSDWGATNALIATNWLNNVGEDIYSYNEGYTIRNEIVSREAFDPNAEYQVDWGNVEWWSQIEAEGSVTDNLRIFLPLDIHFEDYTHGYITEFKNENEEAVVVQQRKTTRAYFNSAAVLTTVEGSEVITGDGGVMNQKGLVVSKFGSSHKWSIIQGKNARGNDVLYGIDVENKCIWRYGYNGEDNLSEMQLIASFAKNNMQVLSSVIDGEVVVKDTPAHIEGICAFANQKYREVGWTFRAWRSDIGEWDEPEFNVEHIFDSTNGNGPYGDLVNVNGVLFGTTAFGGTTNAGIIFTYDPATGTFTKRYDFVFAGANGYQPSAGMVFAANGLLYGCTNLGGANGVGVIFSFNPTSFVYTNVYDMVLATGGNPLGELVEYNAKLYGLASTGGATGDGVLYEYNHITDVYTKKVDLGGVNGAAPQGKMLLNSTSLYGMTRTEGANNVGTLFQYDFTTYTVLHDFISATGSNPVESLAFLGNKLYGTTQFGGLTNTGVLFEFDLLTLTYTSLHDFIASTGNEPMCTPAVVGTMLYGTTRTGGSMNFGAIWQFNTLTGIYLKLIDLNTPNIYPRGQMVLIGNVLYGGTVGTTVVNYGSLFSYNLDGIYAIGDVVQFGTTGFEEFPAFWVSLIDNNIGIEPTGSGDPAVWELILTTDNRYYNVYTLVYNELKDVFQLFMSPKPRIYCVYKNGFLAPRPVDDSGQMYEYDRGNLLEWFNDGSTALTADSWFDAVFNEPKNIRKTFSALRYFSDNKPDRVEITATGLQTYMDAIDFETRENEHECEIHNDSTVTLVGANGAAQNPLGLNNIDTSKMYGYYLVVRTIMRTYNKVNSIICKCRWRSRLP